MPPRSKKKSTAVEDKPGQAAQKDLQGQSEQNPPNGSTRHSPDQPLPNAIFKGIKDQTEKARNRSTTIESEPLSLPNDDIKERHRDVWQRLGFYSHHPNHNPSAINEAEINSMMEKCHKQGKIVSKYRLFMNKPTSKRTMLIQYPNRRIGQEYRAASGNKPLEIRIKPKCGLVEVDIPINIHENYDKEKGVEYGEALRKSRVLQEGGSFGLGGGLRIGLHLELKDDRRVSPEGPLPEKLLENFEDANNKGHVMNKITLGGQIYPFKNGDPIYMSATFKEGEHITSNYHKLLF